MITIPIIFGYLKLHREEQLALCKNPILVCHWNKASWMSCDLYSKRIFCIGRDEKARQVLDYHNAWFNRE